MDEIEVLANTKLHKVCITSICCLSFIAYTMKDLEALMQVNTAKFSIMFAVRSGFYALGAVFFSWLFNHWNRQILFAINMLIGAFTTVLIPILPKFYLFIALGCFSGFAMGAVDTASNVLILEIWGKDNNPILQTLHLCFALGTVIGPLMCAPFVSPDTNTTDSITDPMLQSPIDNQIIIPFGITSGIWLISGFGLIIFEVIKPYKSPERVVSGKERRNETLNEENTDTELLLSPQLPKSYYVCVVSLAGFVIFMLLCAEPMFFSFLPKFLQRIGVEKKNSMYMSAVFGGGFTLFRFLSIFVAIKMKQSSMMYISFLITFISSVCLLVFGLKSVPVLWVASATIGAGFACTYPALFSFVEQRIDVTNIVGGIFMFAGSTATIITPLIIGQFIDEIPQIFLYFNMACVTAMITIFVFLHLTDVWRSKYET